MPRSAASRPFRARIGKPVRIVSGCRCRGRNKSVGGARTSQHMFGAAADIDGLVTAEQRRQMRLFAGLGFEQSTGKVIHVDSRDVSGHNTSNGTPAAPTSWRYAS